MTWINTVPNMFIKHVDDSDNTNIHDMNKYRADHVY